MSGYIDSNTVNTTSAFAFTEEELAWTNEQSFGSSNLIEETSSTNLAGITNDIMGKMHSTSSLFTDLFKFSDEETTTVRRLTIFGETTMAEVSNNIHTCTTEEIAKVQCIHGICHASPTPGNGRTAFCICSGNFKGLRCNIEGFSFLPSQSSMTSNDAIIIAVTVCILLLIICAGLWFLRKKRKLCFRKRLRLTISSKRSSATKEELSPLTPETRDHRTSKSFLGNIGKKAGNGEYTTLDLGDDEVFNNNTDLDDEVL